MTVCACRPHFQGEKLPLNNVLPPSSGLQSCCGWCHAVAMPSLTAFSSLKSLFKTLVSLTHNSFWNEWVLTVLSPLKKSVSLRTWILIYALDLIWSSQDFLVWTSRNSLIPCGFLICAVCGLFVKFFLYCLNEKLSELSQYRIICLCWFHFWDDLCIH